MHPDMEKFVTDVCKLAARVLIIDGEYPGEPEASMTIQPKDWAELVALATAIRDFANSP